MADDQVTLEISTHSLKLLSELASAAENLAEHSKQEGLTQLERAALRNTAKVANEQAGWTCPISTDTVSLLIEAQGLSGFRG